MIVKESDPASRKWKYWAITWLLSFLTIAVCLGIPTFIIFKFINQETPVVDRIFAVALWFLMFWVSRIIICKIENHIGIAGLLQNPNRANLIQWPPDWIAPWIKRTTMEPPSESSQCESSSCQSEEDK